MTWQTILWMIVRTILMILWVIIKVSLTLTFAIFLGGMRGAGKAKGMSYGGGGNN